MENKDKGFIKIYRSMLDWGWYSDANTMRVFLHLLLKANFRETEYQGMIIPIGSTVVGLCALAEQLKLSVQNIRTALKNLKKTGEIEIKSTNKFSIVNIVKYSDYQELDKANQQTTNKQLTNNQQTTNKQLTTSKECKECKECKNIIMPLIFENEKFREIWETYREHRKEIKHKLTPKAEQMALNKLAKMAKNVEDAIAIVEQSIANGWQGLFPLKNNQYNRKQQSFEDVDLMGNPFEDIIGRNTNDQH